MNSFTRSEINGDILHSLHTSNCSNRQIIDRYYDEQQAKTAHDLIDNDLLTEKFAVRVIIKADKSFLYMLSRPHENNGEIQEESLTFADALSYNDGVSEKNKWSN